MLFHSVGCELAKYDACGEIKEVYRLDAQFYLVEDFEHDPRWGLDSADNYGTLAYAETFATVGESCLRVTFTDNGRGKTSFRKEVKYDLSDTRRFLLDVFNPQAATGVSVSLQFVTTKGGYFQAKPRALAPGWNRDLCFSLNEKGFTAGVDLKKWQAENAEISRVMLLVYPGELKNGELFLDNLRSDSPTADAARVAHIEKFFPANKTVNQFARAEARLLVSFPSLHLAAYQPEGTTTVDFGMPLPEDIGVMGRFIGPDNVEIKAPGFFYDWEDCGARMDVRVRFAPKLAGLWRYQIGVCSNGDWVWTQPASFICQPATDRRGLVTIDENDPRYFAYENGEFFYPIGQNIAWAADYEPYLKEVKNYGGNFMRTWICPWNNRLEKIDLKGQYDCAAARAIDRMFELAETYDVQVQLTVFVHGMLLWEWDNTVYSAKNGGPCRDPREFWRNAEAKKMFRQRLDYIVARWGYSRHLLAWELFNEAELAPHFCEEDIVNWHREMSRYLKKIDPHQHLVTTSTIGPDRVFSLWKVEDIDYIQSHIYSIEIGDRLRATSDQYLKFRKPYFVGEFGRGWKPETDPEDETGHHLHQGLWLAWMMNASGSVMPWWWDTYIQPNKLEHNWRGLCLFSRGEDRRGKNYAEISRRLINRNGSDTLVAGLVSPQEAFGYIYTEARLRTPRAEVLTDLLAETDAVTVSGLADGEYRLEIWDTHSGAIACTEKVKVTAGAVVLPLGAVKNDFAFKLKKSVPLTPNVSVGKTESHGE
jgi:hypothetical protein